MTGPQHYEAALNEKKCPLVTVDIEFDDSSSKIADIDLFFGFLVYIHVLIVNTQSFKMTLGLF